MIGVVLCPHCRVLFYGELLALRFAHPCTARDGETVELEIQRVRTLRQVPNWLRRADPGPTVTGDAIIKLSARRLVERNRRVRSVILSSGQFMPLRGNEARGVVVLIYTPGGEVTVSESAYMPSGCAAVTFGDGSVEMLGPGWQGGE
jgi:hypothetical protein